MFSHWLPVSLLIWSRSFTFSLCQLHFPTVAITSTEAPSPLPRASSNICSLLHSIPFHKVLCPIEPSFWRFEAHFNIIWNIGSLRAISKLARRPLNVLFVSSLNGIATTTVTYHKIASSISFSVFDFFRCCCRSFCFAPFRFFFHFNFCLNRKTKKIARREFTFIYLFIFPKKKLYIINRIVFSFAIFFMLLFPLTKK